MDGGLVSFPFCEGMFHVIIMIRRKVQGIIRPNRTTSTGRSGLRGRELILGEMRKN